MIGAIPNRPTGTSARARFYQWVWERLARGMYEVFAGPGIRCTRTARGMMVEALNRGGSDEASSRVQQYLLTDASNGDYFICRTLSRTFNTDDPENPFVETTIGATDIYIAKPFHLRQSPFDRDVLNEEHPELIGTEDEITYDVTVESWDGFALGSETMRLSHNYKGATFRITSDVTDPDNPTSENQTIIPRFVPAALVEEEDEPITTETVAPTIIYAMRCSGLGITYTLDDDTVDITLLALNDTWTWCRSPV